MSLSLDQKFESRIKNLKESGRYNSSYEVLNEALHLLEMRDEVNRIKLEALRRDLQVGIKELKEGKGKPLDFDKLLEELHREYGEKKRNV